MYEMCYNNENKFKENFKMNNITEEESLLLQCLSTTSLLVELFSHNFLNSDYFNKLDFENMELKKIIKMSGLGNPATMQMMLYALLLIPKEILPNDVYSNLNPLIYDAVEKNDTYSTYNNENNIENIDYLRHIRNAVAHSKCNYFNENQINYVVFKDESKSEHCSIKMKCSNVGSILTYLQIFLIKYYNDNHKK